jgi:hypothetical protein
MKFVSVILFGVLSLTRAEDRISTPPAKVRLNTDMLKKVFHARD